MGECIVVSKESRHIFEGSDEDVVIILRNFGEFGEAY
mgnify:CR=1 FL=1